MTRVPLKFVLDLYTPGVGKPDRFGNLIPGEGTWETIKVAQWWVDRTEERQGDSVLRTVDTLHAHIPTHINVSPAGRLRTPDGREWTVEGNPEDFNYGFHGWTPGLIVVHAKEVNG